MPSVLLSPRYLYALELAATLFADHKRDMSDVPFVTHLFGVSYILCQLTNDEDVHIAGLLHDVLEDILAKRYSAAQMERDFGPKVLRLVRAVSYDETAYGKDESRRHYVKQLEKNGEEACLVSGADMLYNGRNFISCYERDPVTAKKLFGGDRARRRDWFWRERLRVIDTNLGEGHTLVRELHDMFQYLAPIHQKIM